MRLVRRVSIERGVVFCRVVMARTIFPLPPFSPLSLLPQPHPANDGEGKLERTTRPRSARNFFPFFSSRDPARGERWGERRGCQPGGQGFPLLPPPLSSFPSPLSLPFSFLLVPGISLRNGRRCNPGRRRDAFCFFSSFPFSFLEGEESNESAYDKSCLLSFFSLPPPLPPLRPSREMK